MHPDKYVHFDFVLLAFEHSTPHGQFHSFQVPLENEAERRKEWSLNENLYVLPQCSTVACEERIFQHDSEYDVSAFVNSYKCPHYYFM